MTPEQFLADSALGRAVFAAVHEIVASFGEVEVRATKSQIAFRRRGGFAYVWLPGKYLAHPQAEVVLSIIAAALLGTDLGERHLIQQRGVTGTGAGGPRDP